MKDYIMIIKQKLTYSDINCKEYDLFVNDEKIGYYVEYYNHPVELTKLDNPVFELYYDYDDEYEEFTSSVIADTLQECLDYINIEESDIITE